MSANIQFRDGSATNPVGALNLGTVVPGTVSTPRKYTLVNTGDAAATNITLTAVPDPQVTNTSGTPVIVPVNGNTSPATTGIYNLTFVANVTGPNPAKVGTDTGVTVDASQSATNQPAWLAFDKNAGTYWMCTNFNGSGNAITAGGEYIWYEWASAVVLSQYSINLATGSGSIANMYLEGSNDAGATWAILDTQLNMATWTTLGTSRVFPLTGNTTAYKRYRLRVTSTVGAAPQIQVAELEMIANTSNPWSCSVNGGAAIGVVTDGVTANTNVISGLDLVFNTNVAASNTATVIINSGHTYTQIAPDNAGTPGTWVNNPTGLSNINLYPNVNAFTLNVVNQTDNSQSNVFMTNAIPQFVSATGTVNNVTINSSRNGTNYQSYYQLFNYADNYTDVYFNVGEWFSVDFGSNNANWPIILAYTLTWGGYSWTPSGWSIQASNDNVNWVNLSTITGYNNSWYAYMPNTFYVDPAYQNTAFRYYRWTMNTISGNNSYCFMSEWQLLKKNVGLSGATYNYAVVGVMSDGRMTTPTRASVTVPTSTTGNSNAISWSAAPPGLSEIRIYSGGVGAERMFVSLPPSATNYLDQFGQGSMVLRGPGLSILETFEEFASFATGTNIDQGTNPNFKPFGNVVVAASTNAITSNTNVQVVQDPIVGVKLRTNYNALEASNYVLQGASGSFQMIIATPSSVANSSRGYLSIGTIFRTDAGNGLFLYDDNGTLKVDVWNANASQATAMGATANGAAPVLSPSTRNLLTVNWDSTGTRFYLNGVLWYTFTNLTTFSSFLKTFDGYRTQCWIARAPNATGLQYGDYMIEEFAFYTQVQSQSDLTSKMQIMSNQATSYILPTSGTANVFPFWFRENVPAGTQPGNQTRTFGLRMTGNTL